MKIIKSKLKILILLISIGSFAYCSISNDSGSFIMSIENSKIKLLHDSSSSDKKQVDEAMDTLNLNNVYIDAFLCNYNNAEYFDAEKSCRLVLFGDSVALDPNPIDSIKRNVDIFFISKPIKEKILYLTSQIVNNDCEPRIRHPQLPYKLYGILEIHPSNLPNCYYDRTICGNLVDSLCTSIYNLTNDLMNLKPERICCVNHVLLAQSSIKHNKEKFKNIMAIYGPDGIMIEEDKISYIDFMRGRIEDATLSLEDKDKILNQFKTKIIVYDNAYSPNINYYKLTSYSMTVNGKPLFIETFPSLTIDLNMTSHSLSDSYIIGMYNIYIIAQKYFPNLYTRHFMLEDDGKLYVQ